MACLVGFVPVPSSGQTERILSFESRVNLHEDGSLTVRETIRVVAAGDQIRHGIYRDFPTIYSDNTGKRYVVGFQIMEVLRDGRTETFHTEKLTNGVRTYFGDPNTILSPGEYTYTLTYRTDHQIGFFEQHDELYWNVTGNGWNFPIDRVSAVIELPDAVRNRVLATDGWTGLKGSTEKAYRMDVTQWPWLRFEATRVLGPKEGLTYVVSWPKGLIPEPTSGERFKRSFIGNTGNALAILGALLVLVYYAAVWVKVGRDPQKGQVIPHFSPPDNLSPAAVRYMHKMGYDHKAFASALIHMAVSGFLTIQEERGKYTLTRQSDDVGALSPEERRIGETLLSGGSSVKLEQSNHAVIQRAVQQLKTDLGLKFNKTYFLTNVWYFVLGMLLSIALLVASTLSFGTPEAAFITVWLTLWSSGVVALLFMLAKAWGSVWTQKRVNPAIIGALFLTLFSIPFIGGEVVGLMVLLRNTSVLLLVALGAVGFMNVLFYHLLKAPTLLGRRLLDKLVGFKMYLGTAEKDRLNFSVPLEKTPETFERFLPYALALDVEQKWAENFAAVVSKSGRPNGSASYHPTWYSGGSRSSFQPDSFASSFGGSLSSAIASSSTAPGSSSGSGGGGSSGGGGGGGGGGGW